MAKPQISICEVRKITTTTKVLKVEPTFVPLMCRLFDSVCPGYIQSAWPRRHKGNTEEKNAPMSQLWLHICTSSFGGWAWHCVSQGMPYGRNTHKCEHCQQDKPSAITRDWCRTLTMPNKRPEQHAWGLLEVTPLDTFSILSKGAESQSSPCPHFLDAPQTTHRVHTPRKALWQ